MLNNAKLKCEAVAQKYPYHLIIAADTVVSLNESILEKPVDMPEAKDIGFIRSETTNLHSSFYYHKDVKTNFIETSNVLLNLNDEDITTYFELVNQLIKPALTILMSMAKLLSVTESMRISWDYR